MSEHTPGPWRHGAPHGFGADGIYASGDGHIAQVYGIWQHRRVDEVIDDPKCATGVANARLIAAAPDMLEVLQAIENDAGRVPAWLWDRIQAVIAKATGATP